MCMKCVGCAKLVENAPYRAFLSCEMWASAEAKWRIGTCPNATHLEKAVAAKKVVNALKASKRGMKHG